MTPLPVIGTNVHHKTLPVIGVVLLLLEDDIDTELIRMEHRYDNLIKFVKRY